MDAAAIDLTVLVERLRSAGFRVDTRQYLSAHELLLAYATRGVSLADDAARLASHLAPIFCTIPEEQQRFALEVAAWRGAPALAEPELKKPPEQPFAVWRRWRLRLAGIVVVAALVVGAGIRLYGQYRDVTLTGAVVVKEADGTEKPARYAKVRYRDRPVTLDDHAGFQLVTNEAAGFGSLLAEMEGYLPASESVSASIERPIVLVLERPPAPDRYLPQLLTIGAPQAISLGAPPPEVETGAPPWRTIALGSIEAALVALLLLSSVIAVRQRLALQRLNALGDAEDATLTPPFASAVALSDHLLRRLASAWRRPREQGIVELNPAATVDATLRMGGLFSPVYTARRATPEYLALVRRRSGEDHWSAFVTEWLDKLANTGVVVDVFDFHDDPRTCYADDDKRRGVRLANLVAQHHRAAVLLFAESDLCFDSTGEALDDWVALLYALPMRVVFTGESPYRWGRRERALAADGFIVLPATGDGFRMFADIAGDWRMERMFPAQYARAYPPLLANDSLRWLDRNTPANDFIEKLIRELRGYLGPSGLSWLCACAVYPQISWPLTLFLSDTASGGDDGPGVQRSILDLLPSLARLPWLQHGFMPDWLRRTLIARMTKEHDALVRQRIESLLERLALAAPSPIGAAGAVTPVKAGALSISRWIGPVDLLRAAPAGSPLSDRVFLGFMSGTNVDPLAVGVTDTLRKLFARGVGAFAEDRKTPPAAQEAPAVDEPLQGLRIFINYRRQDSAPYAGRLSDTLRSRIPGSDLFIDVANIETGTSWREALERAIRAADVVLVIIGPRWLEPQTDTGKPALFREDDFVRTEIATALAGGKPVIPILVGGERMPTESELPSSISALVRYQAISLSDEYWSEGIATLERALQSVPRKAETSARSTEPAMGQVRPAISFIDRARLAAREGVFIARAFLARMRAWMAFRPAAFIALASFGVGLLALGVLRAWLPPAMVAAEPPKQRSFAVFSPDGRWLVTRNAAGKALLISTPQDATAARTPTQQSDVNRPPGSGVRTEQRILSVDESAATAAVFARDNSSVAVGYENGSVRTFEIATGKVQSTIESNGIGEVLALAFRMGGLLTGATTSAVWIRQPAVDPGDALSRRIERRPLARFGLNAADVQAASFDNAGDSLAVLLFNHDKAEFSVRILSAFETLPAAQGVPVDCFNAVPAFSPDGVFVACADKNGGVQVWKLDPTSRQPTAAIKLPAVGGLFEVSSVAFSPGSNVVAGGGFAGQIMFWDISSGRVLGSGKVPQAAQVTATAFSPSGAIFVAATATDLGFWPVAISETPPAMDASQAQSGAGSSDVPPAQSGAASSSVPQPSTPATPVANTDTVPSILRMTPNAARAALDRHQFVLGNAQTRASSAPKGTIVEQDPPRGRREAVGTAVNVAISDGSLVRVPNLVGMPLEIAKKTAASAGLAIDQKGVSTQSTGTVIAQQPRAGVDVERNTPLVVTLSGQAQAAPAAVRPAPNAPPNLSPNDIPAALPNGPGSLRSNEDASSGKKPAPAPPPPGVVPSPAPPPGVTNDENANAVQAPVLPDQGWCCVQSRVPSQSSSANFRAPLVSQRSPSECKNIGGRFASSRDEASRMCGISPLPTTKEKQQAVDPAAKASKGN